MLGGSVPFCTEAYSAFHLGISAPERKIDLSAASGSQKRSPGARGVRKSSMGSRLLNRSWPAVRRTANGRGWWRRSATVGQGHGRESMYRTPKLLWVIRRSDWRSRMGPLEFWPRTGPAARFQYMRQYVSERCWKYPCRRAAWWSDGRAGRQQARARRRLAATRAGHSRRLARLLGGDREELCDSRRGERGHLRDKLPVCRMQGGRGLCELIRRNKRSQDNQSNGAVSTSRMRRWHTHLS